MLSRSLPYTLVLAVGVASAGESLRGVSLGDDCEAAWASEKALGSAESVLEMPGRKIFEGVAYDMNAHIAYQCDAGKIVSQDIMINAGNRVSSRLTYSRVKQVITDLHGQPNPNADEEFLKLAEDQGLDRELVYLSMGHTWNVSDKYRVRLALRPVDSGGYYVVVSQ